MATQTSRGLGWPPRPFVPGPFREFTDDDDYLRRKFREDVTDPTTGLALPELKEGVKKIAATENAAGTDWTIVKARMFAYLCDNMAIDVSPRDRFPAIACWNRWDRPLSPILGERAGQIDRDAVPAAVLQNINAGNNDGSHKMWHDFDHSAPDWDVIIPLGFGGLASRLKKFRRAGARYEALQITMDAMLRAVDRFIAQAEKNGCAREAAALRRLRDGAPQSAYDVLMFIWLYFFFSEHLDHMQVRSLSHIDFNLRPYYEADLAAGRTTKKEFHDDFRSFIWQWGSIDNYWGQPVYMGGSTADGKTVFSDISRIELEVFDECALPTPKLQIKVDEHTPAWVWDKALDMARRHRSVAFMGGSGIYRAMKKRGFSEEDAKTAAIWGCYEFGPRHALNGTAGGHVNMLKPMETLLDAARRQEFAPADFGEFKRRYLDELRRITENCRDLAVEFEKPLAHINPANVFTIAMEEALANGRDAFADGLQSNNCTHILGVGLGTAVDALLAVKEAVYDRKLCTLAELGQIMADDWAGQEKLRLRLLKSKRKWGNNDADANRIGKEIARVYGDCLNGKANGRGGLFESSGHSARMHIEFGKQTGSTPDGRRAGQEMSKNLSPTMGADTEGVTALVATLANIAVEDFPGDMPLDVMMHPSAAAGTEGLQAMKAVARIYHQNGGTVVQFNVVSADELRDAQAHPEQYENLQVRICGWNIRWNDVPRIEQDEYIRRAENIA